MATAEGEKEGMGLVENKEHGCSWKKELLEPCPRQSASVDAGRLFAQGHECQALEPT